MDTRQQKQKREEAAAALGPITTRIKQVGISGDADPGGTETSTAEVSGANVPQGAASGQIFSVPWERNFCLSLLLALLTIGLYTPIMHAPFLNFEDPAYIAQNSHVTAGLKWSTVVWAFHSTEQSIWQPLTWLSHTLDCRRFGLNPAGPHTTNVIIHSVNAVLLFLILASATGFLWRSLAVAALFALHPINVEAVAWIAQRKDVLSTLFLLLALAAYGWYARRPTIPRYIVVTIAYALGLMSDAQVVTFPFAILLLDYWPMRRLAAEASVDTQLAASPSSSPRCPSSSSWRKLLAEKLPWFAMSAASAVITVKAQAGATQSSFPWSIRVENAAISYAKYLGKAFWPANLAPIYPHPMDSIGVAASVIAALGLIAISILALIYRRQRPFFVGWFWFLGTLVPMLGLVQFSDFAMADRFAYIPLIGIFVIVCWGVAEFTSWRQFPKLVPAVAIAIVLASCAVVLRRQEGFWLDNVKLWTHTVQITEKNYVAEDNLATSVLEQGEMEEAIAHFRLAHQYRPDDALSALNLAIYEHMHKHYQAAAEGYSSVVAVTKVPKFLMVAWVNGGYTRLALKQYSDAANDFQSALQQDPDNSDAYRGLGLLAQKHGNMDEAIKDYKRSVELKPSGSGFLLLAQALELKGKKEEARAARSTAQSPLFRSPENAALVQELLQY